MKLLGLNFNKLKGEKISDIPSDLKINTKLDVLDIAPVKSESFKFKEEVLAIKFLFELDYTPNCAKIEVTGNFLLSLDSKKVKEVLRDWEKKEISEDFKIALFNIIMRKASFKALQLEEDLNLPYHFQFPLLKRPDDSSKSV